MSYTATFKKSFWFGALTICLGGMLSGCPGENSGASDTASQQDQMEQDASFLSLDPSELDPDTIVFAFTTEGGMHPGFEDLLYSEHHGPAVYVFGDGRVLRHSSEKDSHGYFWAWYEGQLPELAWADLQAKVSALTANDGGYYDLCLVMDGGSDHLFMTLPEAELEVWSGGGFAGYVPGCEQSGEHRDPRPELVDFVNAVHGLEEYAETRLVTDDILVAGIGRLADSSGCDAAVEWPFAELVLPQVENWDFFHFPVQAPLAAQVRTFFEEHGESHYFVTCVSQEDSFYLLTFDDALPDDATYPFYSGDIDESNGYGP